MNPTRSCCAALPRRISHSPDAQFVAQVAARLSAAPRPGPALSALWSVPRTILGGLRHRHPRTAAPEVRGPDGSRGCCSHALGNLRLIRRRERLRAGV